MKRLRFLATLASIVIVTFAATSVRTDAAARDNHAGGDALHGEQLYVSRCGACHSLDANGAGPRHRGIIGRRVASLADFSYSAALARQKFVWNAARLDRWLADPSAFVPGNKMVVRLADDPRDRRDLIAYLVSKSVSAEGVQR